MNRHQVVDAIALQLAERRRRARARHAAYQALARAIVGGPADQSLAFEGLPPSADHHNVAAAA